MQITLIAALSLNGKITFADLPPAEWASAEDQIFFAQQIKERNLIVMGRKTYQMAKSMMQLKPGKLRIVLTKDMARFQSEVVPGQLEFSRESPLDLVLRLEKLGYSEMLLVGGGEINAAFMASDLVNEFLITLEPKIFAEGTELFAQQIVSRQKLLLVEVTQLNQNGTLLLKYEVVPKIY